MAVVRMMIIVVTEYIMLLCVCHSRDQTAQDIMNYVSSVDMLFCMRF